MEGGGDGGSEFSLLSSKAKAKAPPTKPVVSLEGGNIFCISMVDMCRNFFFLLSSNILRFSLQIPNRMGFLSPMLIGSVGNFISLAHVYSMLCQASDLI